MFPLSVTSFPPGRYPALTFTSLGLTIFDRRLCLIFLAVLGGLFKEAKALLLNLKGL